MSVRKNEEELARIDLRVRKSEKDGWQELADKDGITLSEWIRQRCASIKTEAAQPKAEAAKPRQSAKPEPSPSPAPTPKRTWGANLGTLTDDLAERDSAIGRR